MQRGAVEARGTEHILNTIQLTLLYERLPSHFLGSQRFYSRTLPDLYTDPPGRQSTVQPPSQQVAKWNEGSSKCFEKLNGVSRVLKCDKAIRRPLDNMVL